MATKLQRLRDNIAAIQGAFALQKGSKNYEDSIDTIDKYSGFGGLTFVLNPLDTSAWTKSDLDCFCDTICLQQMLRDNSKGEKEYEAWMQSLKASTLTAYYTPNEVVDVLFKVIYKSEFGCNRVHIAPRRILDPAAGRGVFAFHANGYAACAWPEYWVTAYEKDILTGLILDSSKGYAKMSVNVTGFETIPNDDLGKFDLVATNVPFGDIQVYDPAYSNSKDAVRREAARMIHRYYVLKGLDCLRDGGLLAYIITSNYINRDTEQLREALKQARLIGAYRLPNNLFKDAGTEVGTDLLVLQKDTKRGELTDAECMLLTPFEDHGCPTNYYFTAYREHIVNTTWTVGTDAYGKRAFVYFHRGGAKGIAEDLQHVLADDLRDNVDVNLFNNCHNDVTASANNEKPKRQTKQEVALQVLHGCYLELYENEQQTETEDSETRQNLNALYDEYVKKYGMLYEEKTRQIANRLKIQDVLALEVKDDDGHYVKADIMLKPIAFSTEESNEPMTAKEALAQSLNVYGFVNIDYMAMLTDAESDELLEELSGEVFYNPISNKYEIRAKFVSGNVIEKIEKIEEYKNNYNKAYGNESSTLNSQLSTALAALKAAVPTPIPFEDLDFNLGERWVDANVYGKFASEFFSMPDDADRRYGSGKTVVTVKYEPTIDQYAVSASCHNEKIWSQYSVHSEASNTLDGMDLLTHALQNTCPTMMRYKRDKDGRCVYTANWDKVKEEDPENTQLAAAKIEEIRQGYVDWLQRQPKEFCNRLADVYNRRFNCFAKPKYDGSHQTFPGLDMAGLKAKYGIEHIYQSQKDCVWMLLMNGGGICDHEVGSGKTLIMCLAAHEMKRLGMCHKPMIIGLKANVSAIAETYRTAYPDAKILFATESDYSASNRVDFFNKMKNNDYDCIIMSHDQFGRIPQSDDIQEELLRDELRQLDDALELLEEWGYNISSKMRRGLEMRKRNLNAKLDKLLDSIKNRKDNVVDFRMMGIDHIFVDESHQYKNLGFTTRHNRVAGLGNTEGSKRAFNLLMAIRTIQQRTGRDLGATFLSGTTVTNSLTELYALFRYLRPKALRAQRITCFDAWAAIFTKKTSEYEFSVTNTIQLKERFRYFIKVPELAMFYNEITDFRTAEDVGIERPKKNAMLLNIKPTPDQERYIKVLMEFAKKGDFSLIGIDNPTDAQKKAKMLYATDQARKMSLDMRLIKPLYKDHPNNKASRCAEQIAKYYRQYDKQKGTQLVFSDLSTWQGASGPWNVYSEIKNKLISEYGIPASEIHFIQECKCDRAKQKMIDEVNKGNIRVLFGSTSMLGTGVNAQKRIVAVHHLDTPWRPSDLEQRDGRAVRKGNEIAKLYADNKVDVIIYAVERSLDSYKFNLLHCKQTFINQLKRGQLSIRTLDEGAMDENTGMNFAEYMALLSGNTDLLERAKLEKKIAGLESERKSFLRDHAEQEQKRESLISENERHERNIKDAREDFARFEKAKHVSKDGVVSNEITLSEFSGASGLSGEKRIKAIGNELLRISDEERTGGNYHTVGSIYGFDVVVKTTYKIGLLGKTEPENHFFVKGSRINYQHSNGKLNHTSPRLAAEYPLQVLQYIPTLISEWEEHMENNRVRIEQLSSILTLTWGKEDELCKLRTALTLLDRKIEKELRDSETPQQPIKAAA